MRSKTYVILFILCADIIRNYQTDIILKRLIFYNQECHCKERNFFYFVIKLNIINVKK